MTHICNLQTPSRLQLTSHEAVMELSKALDDASAEHRPAIVAAGVRFVSPAVIPEHFDWHMERLNSQFDRAMSDESSVEGKKAILLSNSDLALLKFLTNSELSATDRPPSPIEIKPKQIPPVAIPIAQNWADVPEVAGDTYQAYELLDDHAPAIRYTPGFVPVGDRADDAVIDGISTRMAKRLAVGAARQSANQAGLARKQKRRHVLLGDGPATSYDKVSMNIGRDKKQNRRMRTVDLDTLSFVPSAFYRSKYVGLLGELKFHNATHKEQARADDGVLHAPQNCHICDWIGDRISIKPYPDGTFRYIINRQERNLIFAMHLYCNKDIQIDLDDFIDRTGTLRESRTPTPSVVASWAQIGRYSSTTEIQPDTEIADDPAGFTEHSAIAGQASSLI